MVLPLTFQSEQLNRVDTTNPRSDAAAIFFSEQVPPRPNAIRHEARGFRTIFSTILQNAISESAPAPNNNRTVIQRILAWRTGAHYDPESRPPAG
jgi:hypothetical protein